MRAVRLRSDTGRDALGSVRLQIGAGGLFLALLRDVLAAFPEGMRVVLQIHPDFRASDLGRVIGGWGLADRHRFTIVRNEVVSPFARDNAKAGRQDAEPVLVVPRSFRAGGDRAADDLRVRFGTAFAGKRLVASRLVWEGGDVISTSRHLVVAAGSVADSARALGVTTAEARRRFEAELGQELLVLGDSRSPRQPDAHLDLSLTVLEASERPVALVADPVAGARLAASESEAFLRRRVAGQFVPPAEAARLAIRSWRDSARRREPRLRRYAEQLRETGYRVVRVPDLNVWDGETHLWGTPLSSHSTNVVLDGERRTAFSLASGIRSVERAAAAVYRREGWRRRFVNRTLPAAWQLMRLGGGLHCMCGEWE